MRLKTGWLSPSGELIRCDYLSHAATATEILEKINTFPGYNKSDDDFLLENLGYVKIGFSMFGKQEYYILWEKSLTDLQIRYLQDIIEEEDKLDFPLGFTTKIRLKEYFDF